jgi:hypothetical protein
MPKAIIARQQALTAEDPYRRPDDGNRYELVGRRADYLPLTE